MWTPRNFKSFSIDLDRLKKQGAIAGLINNADNAGQLNWVIDNIRDAMLEYQVRTQVELTFPVPDVCFRRHCNKISTIRTVSSL